MGSARRGLFLMASVAALSLAVPAAVRADWAGDVNFLIGSKSLDSADWEPVENQSAIGFESSWGPRDWPVRFALDYIGSGGIDEPTGGPKTTAGTAELAFGVRKLFNEEGRIRPYIGGGIASIGAAAKIGASEDTGGATGLWAGGGVFWRLGSRFNIGMSLRLSSAEVTLFNNDMNAGGTVFGLTLGWGWPAFTPAVAK